MKDNKKIILLGRFRRVKSFILQSKQMKSYSIQGLQVKIIIELKSHVKKSAGLLKRPNLFRH